MLPVPRDNGGGLIPGRAPLTCECEVGVYALVVGVAVLAELVLDEKLLLLAELLALDSPGRYAPPAKLVLALGACLKPVAIGALLVLVSPMIRPMVVCVAVGAGPSCPLGPAPPISRPLERGARRAGGTRSSTTEPEGPAPAMTLEEPALALRQLRGSGSVGRPRTSRTSAVPEAAAGCCARTEGETPMSVVNRRNSQLVSRNSVSHHPLSIPRNNSPIDWLLVDTHRTTSTGVDNDRYPRQIKAMWLTQRLEIGLLDGQHDTQPAQLLLNRQRRDDLRQLLRRELPPTISPCPLPTTNGQHTLCIKLPINVSASSLSTWSGILTISMPTLTTCCLYPCANAIPITLSRSARPKPMTLDTVRPDAVGGESCEHSVSV